jgi:energy-coupling factor transporter ATP-binding protein EcfA2
VAHVGRMLEQRSEGLRGGNTSRTEGDSFFVITGGPGSGKSTLIEAIEGDRGRTRPRAGAQRKMMAERVCCCARNGRSPGEESRGDGVAAQAIEAQPIFGHIKPMRGRVFARRTDPGDDVADDSVLAQEAQQFRQRECSAGEGKGGLRPMRSNCAASLNGTGR